MNRISSFWKWLSNIYKKQKMPGKIFFGCVSLTLFCCLCSVPINLLSPNSAQQVSPTIATSTREIIPSATRQLPTATNTRIPTFIVSSTPTSALPATPTATATLPFTPSPTEDQIFASAPECVPHTNVQRGKVLDVVDGDTIKVLIDGVTFSVRYVGIDTPESTIEIEYFGKEASEKNKELVDGKDVTLVKDVSEKDKFGRLLRYVFVDDVFVNYELVNQGYANAVTYPPDVSCVNLFRSAQSYAQLNGLGLWDTTSIQATATLQSIGSPIQIVAVNKVAEYVDIRNLGASPVNLSGWRLVSEKGSQSCALGGIIQPGETLRVWAGNPADQEGYKCGINGTIWNNNESDPAVLYDEQGREVDRY